MSKKKFVYYFGDGKADGTGKMKDLLGGKGAGLANMVNLKFPVPSGFTITTEACNIYFENKKKYPAGLWDQVLANLKKVERSMGAKLGDAKNPLLLSVRSGSKFSMPGMMDTVLNLGLNETTLKALAERTGNERFALDTYRRLITMFGSTVMGVDRVVFAAGPRGKVQGHLQEGDREGIPQRPAPAAEAGYQRRF
jgi:pyruvate,orthophosphate dikinase